MAVKLLPFLLLFAGCAGSTGKSPGGYMRYVEDEAHGLKTTIRSGVWSYGFQYKPAAYMVLRETGANRPAKEAFGKKVMAYDSSVWFNVVISVADKTTDPLKYGVRDLQEYNTRLDYFLNGAASNFHLTYGGGGELPQIGYYFENNYSIKPEVTAIVGFKLPEKTPRKLLTLEYDDGLFNAGILKFNITPETIHAVPEPAL